MPHDQTWGRFHPEVDGNATWELSSSEDGDQWSTTSSISPGALIETTDSYLRFHASLIDGCINQLNVDINDPTLSIMGEIIGDIHSMVDPFAQLRVAVNGEEVTALAFTNTTGMFQLDASIGHLLTPGGGMIEIGLSARFHWSSNGSSEDIVIQIQGMNIAGGFLIEWDRDPVCDGQDDQIFEEDGGGRLLEFLYTCSDDITANSDLIVTVTSLDTSILDASFVNGQLRLQPVYDAFGETVVTIVVKDERQNEWVDEIAVIITPIDDSPEMDELPVGLTMELNEPFSIPFSYWDRDTPSNSLDITISPSWAVFSGGVIEFSPVQPGTQTISISVCDGETEISQEMSLIVTQRANLWVSSIGINDVETGESSITEGSDIQINVYVRNSGSTIAQPVTVRCSVNGQNIGMSQIAVIEAGGIASTTCNEWNRLDIQSGEVSLEVEIDWTDTIDETNEDDNLWSSDITVHDREGTSGEASGSLSDSNLSNYNAYLWVGVIILGLLGILVFMYGPNQIRKVE